MYMVKKTSSKKKAVKTILVSVSRFGYDPLAIEVKAGATIDEVLDKAELEVDSNQQIFVSGEQVGVDDEVEMGDVLSIVSPKAAGSY